MAAYDIAGVSVETSPTLKKVWWDTIRNHPWDYMAHRLSAFGDNLRIAGDAKSQCLEMTPLTNIWNYREAEVQALLRHDCKLTPVQDRLRYTMLWLARKTPSSARASICCYRWPAAMAWGLSPLRRGDPLPFYLAFSGLAQQGTLLFLAPSINYRYSHWLVVSSWLATLLLVANTWAAARRRRSSRLTTSEASAASSAIEVTA